MVRFTALFFTVLTGASALVYEVAWQRYLATLLGSHGEATAAVLAIFLGGLALGYALFGRLTRLLVARARRSGRPARLLLAYGCIEAGIGVYALLFPALFGVAQWVSLLVPGGEALGFGFDVTLSALLIGPPSVLMGGTIPLLTLALAGDLEHATRIHAWVYGFNTIGAFAGALLGGFWIVPVLGLDGTLYTVALVNLLAGAVFAALDRRTAGVTPDLGAAAEPAESGPAPQVLACACVALLAGFAMMVLQTTLNRVGALAFGSSQFTFAMVVAVFVLCIALGSLAVSALPRVPRHLLVDSQWLLLLLLVLLYLALPDSPYWAHRVRVVFRGVDAAFYPYYTAVFLGLLALLVVPIGISGALLPLLFDHLRREVGDLGAVAGRLYAWNTVGSLLGALLGGYILLFWLDLHHVYRIAIAAIGAGVAILMVVTTRATPLGASLLVAAPVIGALLLLPAWDANRMTAGLFRQRSPGPYSFKGADALLARRSGGEIVFYDDDPTSTVTVKKSRPRPRNVADAGDDQAAEEDATISLALEPDPGPTQGDPDDLLLSDAPPEPPDLRLSLSIIVNGKSDGNLIGDYPTMALSALIPALMAERNEKAFVIGWGTGVTAGQLAALEAMRRVEVAEISKGVIDASPLFDPGNFGASRSPKVGVRRGDAYRTLLQRQEQYDIIVSEPSNPWVTGVEMLYSIEFLEAARSRLAPGGVYGQWFHLYEIDTETVELVLRNYTSVFPYVSVWFTMKPDLLLLGFEGLERATNLPALERRFRQPDFESGFELAGIQSFPALLAHELLPVGTLRREQLAGPLHTLRHPILSYQAARAFFRGGVATLPPFAQPGSAGRGTRNSLLRRYAESRQGRAREAVWQEAAREYCEVELLERCATLLARWRSEFPNSPRLARALAELRRARPNAQVLREPVLNSLVRLHRGRIEGPNPRPLLRARRTTERFLNFYHHAAAFDRRVLEDAWRDCTMPICEEPRRVAESYLGPLDGRRRRPQRAGAPGPTPM